MREDAVDLWTYQAQARCITTNGSVKSNGRAVMGRGVAKQACDHYFAMQITLGKAILMYGNHVLILFENTGVANEPALVSFPVKYEWDQLANLDLILRSTKELVTLTDQKGWTQVVLPRPGCGNGHRKWREVRPILQPLLDDRFTVVTL